ncbi:MAG: chemotaxis protein CheA, partial [Gammaproteobacteria bacterium]|nr:chemotaxis protein CheA [Gammaproteobacteria bacterium]
MLDGVRNGEIAPTTPMIDTLLACVDCLGEMLNNPEDDEAVPEQRLVELQGQLQEYIDTDQPTAEESGTAVEAGPTEQQVSSVDENGLSLQGQHRWVLRFSPLTHLFETGNDPLRLLQEITTLGELEVHLDGSQLPELAENFDPEKCYLAWDLTLTSDVDEVAIREIFEWVEDDCELYITLLSSDDDQQIDLEPEQGEPAEADHLQPPEQTNGSTDPGAVDAAKGSVIELVADHSDLTTDAPDEPNLVSSSTQKSSSQKSSNQKKAGKPKGDGPSIRVSTDKVDHLINMVGELVITHSMLNQLSEVDELGELEMEKMRDGLSSLNRNIRELQERVMSIRMLPISVVFNRFPRMVRDLSNQLGKQIVLEIKGEGTELDKTVLESMGDPLTHLVRNSLDHGLE